VLFSNCDLLKGLSLHLLWYHDIASQSFKRCSSMRFLIRYHPTDCPFQYPIRHPWIERPFSIGTNLSFMFIMCFDHRFLTSDNHFLAIDHRDLFTVEKTFCNSSTQTSEYCTFCIYDCYLGYPRILISFPFGLFFTSSSMVSVLPPAFFIFSCAFSEKDQAAIETFFVSFPGESTFPGINAVSFS
jgi:hypothetical protein